MIDVSTDSVTAGKHNTDIKVFTAADIFTLFFVKDGIDHLSGLISCRYIIQNHKCSETSDGKIGTNRNMDIGTFVISGILHQFFKSHKINPPKI